MKSPMMPLYVNNWLGSFTINTMTPAQEGAFIRLLLHQWQSDDCSLPNNDEELSMLSRLGSDWKILGAKVKGCFQLIDGKLRNERCWHEWNKRNKYLEACREGGRLTSISRWGDEKHEEETLEEPTIPTWRTDFNIYLAQETEVFNQLYNDASFIKQQQELNPFTDIKLSLKKAHINFWSTKAGWKNKKKGRTSEIDWKATFINAIDINKVNKPRLSNDEVIKQKRLDADNKLRQRTLEDQKKRETWELELQKSVAMMKNNPEDYESIKANCKGQDDILGRVSGMLLSEALEEWWKEFQADILNEKNKSDMNF